MVSSETLDEIDNFRISEEMRKVEAILFVSARFLDIKELVSFSDLNPIILYEILEKLREHYEKINSSILIVEKNGKWKMDVKSEYSDILHKLATGNAEFSKAEQETLAIIAYKQPLKQSVIIKIRGNKAYDHIKKFDELGLIKKKKLGHTYELSLSETFYDYFGVPEKSSQNG